MSQNRYLHQILEPNQKQTANMDFTGEHRATGLKGKVVQLTEALKDMMQTNSALEDEHTKIRKMLITVFTRVVSSTAELNKVIPESYDFDRMEVPRLEAANVMSVEGLIGTINKALAERSENLEMAFAELDEATGIVASADDILSRYNSRPVAKKTTLGTPSHNSNRPLRARTPEPEHVLEEQRRPLPVTPIPDPQAQVPTASTTAPAAQTKTNGDKPDSKGKTTPNGKKTNGKS